MDNAGVRGDLLVACLEGGLSLDASLAKVVDRTDGPLAIEIRRTLQEMALGPAPAGRRLHRPSTPPAACCQQDAPASSTTTRPSRPSRTRCSAAAFRISTTRFAIPVRCRVVCAAGIAGPAARLRRLLECRLPGAGPVAVAQGRALARRRALTRRRAEARERWRGLVVLVLAFPPVYFGLIDGENAIISLLL